MFFNWIIIIINQLISETSRFNKKNFQEFSTFPSQPNFTSSISKVFFLKEISFNTCEVFRSDVNFVRVWLHV